MLYLHLLCKDTNDCGSKTNHVFPWDGTPFCSEGQVIADELGMRLPSWARFSFLPSGFDTEGKVGVTDTNWMLSIEQIFSVLRFHKRRNGNHIHILQLTSQSLEKLWLSSR